MKQLTEFFFSENRTMKFSRVVLIEYPRKGVWSLAFLTGGALPATGGGIIDAVTVFVPSSPTPFTGYTITLPRAEVRDTDISVEEALKFIVSGGVIMPQLGSRPGANVSAAERSSAAAAALPPPRQETTTGV